MAKLNVGNLKKAVEKVADRKENILSGNNLKTVSLSEIIENEKNVLFRELTEKEMEDELQKMTNQGVVVRILDVPTTLMDFSVFGELQKSIMEMVNTILIEVLSTQAETELIKIKKRQAEGIAIAKKQGKYTGRKAKELPKNFPKLYDRWKNKELSATEFCKILEYKSRSTLYLKIKQYENNLQNS